MQLSLKYDYASSCLRSIPVTIEEGPNITIVLTSNQKDTVFVGFTREDSEKIALGYKSAAMITKTAIQALWDLLKTNNSMIDNLKSDKIKIRMSIVASKQTSKKRVRMYKALIDKNIAIFENSKEIKYRHNKTVITNDTIVIFIQRHKSI